MAVSKDKSITKKSKLAEKRIASILDQATVEELRCFLAEEFRGNPSMRTNFTIFFTGKDTGAKSISDYKKDLYSFYKASAEGGYIEWGIEVDFSRIHDFAERYAKAKNMREAIKLYQALSETIAENMDRVDDSNGYYGSEFDKAIDGMVESIKKAKLEHTHKKPYID